MNSISNIRNVLIGRMKFIFTQFVIYNNWIFEYCCLFSLQYWNYLSFWYFNLGAFENTQLGGISIFSFLLIGIQIVFFRLNAQVIFLRKHFLLLPLNVILHDIQLFGFYSIIDFSIFISIGKKKHDEIAKKFAIMQDEKRGLQKIMLFSS